MEELTTKTLDDFKKDGKSIVVFGAPWCTPCNAMKVRLEEIEKTRKDVNFGYVNVDKNGYLGTKYKISGVPMCIIFQDGKPKYKIDGLVKQETIIEALSED